MPITDIIDHGPCDCCPQGTGYYSGSSIGSSRHPHGRPCDCSTCCHCVCPGAGSAKGCLPDILILVVSNLSIPSCAPSPDALINKCNDTAWLNNQQCTFVSDGTCTTWTPVNCDPNACGLTSGNEAQRHWFECFLDPSTVYEDTTQDMSCGNITCPPPPPCDSGRAALLIAETVTLGCLNATDAATRGVPRGLWVNWNLEAPLSGEAGGCCWATTPNGLDTSYPSGHAGLATYTTAGPVCDADGFVSQSWDFTTPAGITGTITVLAG